MDNAIDIIVRSIEDSVFTKQQILANKELVDRIHQVVNHIRVSEVELNQVVVTFPALIPEAVIPGIIAVEVDVKPVFIR